LRGELVSAVSQVTEAEALTRVSADAQALWDSFETAVDEETECLLEPFCHFPAGTPTETVWHWFDAHASGGVHRLMFPQDTA
jgi:hypothetical protein